MPHGHAARQQLIRLLSGIASREWIASDVVKLIQADHEALRPWAVNGVASDSVRDQITDGGAVPARTGKLVDMDMHHGWQVECLELTKHRSNQCRLPRSGRSEQ